MHAVEPPYLGRDRCSERFIIQHLDRQQTAFVVVPINSLTASNLVSSALDSNERKTIDVFRIIERISTSSVLTKRPLVFRCLTYSMNKVLHGKSAIEKKLNEFCFIADQCLKKYFF